jgi:two-component system, cell cycle sensor histidine kinase and response regulator CckA
VPQPEFSREMNVTELGRRLHSSRGYLPNGRAGLSLVLLVLLAPFCVRAQTQLVENSERQILVLNSYHVGYFWTDMIVQGIRSTLYEYPQAQIHFEFMDTRRHPDPQYLDQQLESYRQKYKGLKFDVIISSDDAALQFLMQHQDELFPGTPVVFCGVNDLKVYDFADRPLFTGLAEVTDLETNVALALRLHPKAKRVVVITDQKLTLDAAKAGNARLQRAFAALEFVFLNPEEMLPSDLKRKLGEMPADTIGLLGAVFRDRSFQAMTAEKSTREITLNCPFPFYGVNANTFGYGIVGGCLNDGYFQGVEAAKRAIAILKGTRPSDQPILRESVNRYQFDYTQLRRWNIDSSRLPQGSIIINVPPSFYQRYRLLIWLTAGFVALQTIAIFALLLNINRRRKAEASLRQSEASLEEAQSIAHVGSWRLDLGNRQLTWSRETYRIFGQDQDRCAITPEFVCQQVNPAQRSILQAASRHAQASGEPYGVEYFITRPDRSQRLIREQAHIALDSQGKPCAMVGTVQDITELRRLEEQLQHSQKLEAIGTLAGGIAHDFNNLLTAINGYCDLILERLPESDPIRSDVADIHKAGQRAAELTQQLLAFSRKQVLKPRVINLNSIVERVERTLLRVLGEDIQLKKQLDPQLWTVKADPGQIEQVIMNLAVNARDAMPKGGSLKIETSNAVLDSTHQQSVPGEYVLMAVADTGCGMDSATLSRIFEPFYTTKEVGRGTGLGLSTIYGIIRQSSGYIYPSSEPGNGTIFKVYLPRCRDPITQADSLRQIESKQGSETVLIVEDEMAVRDFACQVLERKGYHVLEAADAAQAIEISQAFEGPIHLLISDVVMPGMGGMELVQKMALVRPEMKVLFISGYAENPAVRESIQGNVIDFLQKPFGMGTLLEKVRHVLDGR